MKAKCVLKSLYIVNPSTISCFDKLSMSCFCVQDLLQLQYDGVAVMKMFDKAKVNVNLLIFLLNKKFYGK